MCRIQKDIYREAELLQGWESKQLHGDANVGGEFVTCKIFSDFEAIFDVIMIKLSYVFNLQNIPIMFKTVIFGSKGE